jgi:4'-phosphopantetheinyl transferase EntD
MTRYFDWLAADGVAVHEMSLDAAPSELFPEERIGLERAVPKRIREFTAGRHCARRCLEELGFAPVAIPSESDRLPLWPEGVTGSITHTDDHCAAVIARRSRGITSIGIDLEPDDDLPADILDTICRPEELAWLEEHQSGERGLLAKAIFSAKECAYKAQYPLSRELLEFHDFRVRLRADEQRFDAEFMRDCAPFARGQQLSGQLRIGNGGIACALIIRGG